MRNIQSIRSIIRRGHKLRSRKRKKQQHNSKPVLKSDCEVCKTKCVDQKPEPRIICHIRPQTRGYMKLLNEFVIIEVYRCMPLLGNEEENVPGWNVHIVHYSIVFMKQELVGKQKL